MKLGVLTVPLQAMPRRMPLPTCIPSACRRWNSAPAATPTTTISNLRFIWRMMPRSRRIKSCWRNTISRSAPCPATATPVHPNKETAAAYHQVFVDTCKLAQKLGVETVVTFSGCPGDSETSQRPNWVTCAWPNDYTETLDWQWNQVLIPYWKEAAEIAKSYGVKKIAFEMHPGFCVYNPATLLRLRAAVGDIIGANFDPSQLIWQGMDPVMALRELKGAV